MELLSCFAKMPSSLYRGLETKNLIAIFLKKMNLKPVAVKNIKVYHRFDGDWHMLGAFSFSSHQKNASGGWYWWNCNLFWTQLPIISIRLCDHYLGMEKKTTPPSCSGMFETWYHNTYYANRFGNIVLPVQALICQLDMGIFHVPLIDHHGNF